MVFIIRLIIHRQFLNIRLHLIFMGCLLMLCICFNSLQVQVKFSLVPEITSHTSYKQVYVVILQIYFAVSGKFWIVVCILPLVNRLRLQDNKFNYRLNNHDIRRGKLQRQLQFLDLLWVLIVMFLWNKNIITINNKTDNFIR